MIPDMMGRRRSRARRSVPPLDWGGYEKAMAVCVEEIEAVSNCLPEVPWTDFLLNPRRLRGSDFLMRWSQGAWSERRILQAVNDSPDFLAVPYGPSGTAPTDDHKAYELYWEELDKAGLSKMKRPDILLFRRSDRERVEQLLKDLGGVERLPFVPESDPRMRSLIERAFLGVECENSLWKARKMPDFHTEMKPQKRMRGKMGLKKGAVLPTIIVKEEDRKPIRDWQKEHGVPIHVWHVFFDLAYGIPFDRIEDLVRKGLVQATVQVFQAPGGATQRKIIYKVYYHYGYPLGEAMEVPRLVADHVEDKNGHILPYVRFEGGVFRLTEQAIALLAEFAARGAGKR